MSSRFSPVRPTQRWADRSRASWALRSAAVSWIDIPTARLPCNFDSVRGKEVFLVQPTSPPVNDHLVGLLALADACSRAVDRRRAATVSGQRLARQTVLKRLRRRPPQGG